MDMRDLQFETTQMQMGGNEYARKFKTRTKGIKKLKKWLRGEMASSP